MSCTLRWKKRHASWSCPASQDKHNNWGPVYSNERYDLRIDKHPGREQYTLMLLHKAK